eukprot:SM000098S25102  [mRNA]  locus=s98:250191:260088:+ [translate_table: standard]
MEAPGDDGAARDDGLHFLEKLAFAQDRRQVLDELLPGCEDDYFHRGQQLADVDHCAGLLALQEGRIDEAVATLQKMEDALGSTSGIPHASAAFRELRTRVRLRQWDFGQTADTSAFLCEELDLRFDDKQDRLPGVPDGARQLPSQLPSQCSTMDHLLGLLLASDRRHSVGALADGALAWVAKSLLQALHNHDSVRAQLLERLQRPVVPLLVDLIVQDGTIFGGLSIHGKLTLQQMDELRDKLPEVATMPLYVQYYCQKLQPPADVSLSDDTELSRFLDRLQPIALLRTTLQAEVLLGRLMLGVRQGRYDPAILKDYLKVHKHRGQPPEYANTSHPAYLRQTEVNMHDVTRNNHVESFLDGLVPGWQAIDAPAVVKAYFLALFSQARSTEFLDADADVRGTLEDWQELFQAGLLSEVYCTRLLAEARLCAGVPNSSEYLDILRRAHEADRRSGPSETAARALFERVEIEFSPANPRVWSANADITLQVILKHVPELTIKVFEINLLNYFTENPEQCVVQPDIDLDGYTPGHEEVRRMKSMSPLLRSEVQLQLHEFQIQRGCVVVDLSGNGAASRAILHKGSLSFVERQSAAGHVMRVLREDGSWAGATTSAIVDGREYHAEGKLNEIVIPFSSYHVPQQRVLLREGSMVSVGFFQHHQERYELQADMWLSEGSLLAKQEAPLVVRTSLLVNGFPAPLAILESPRIVVTQRCKGAVTISHEVPHVVLSDHEDLVHCLRVHHKVEGFTVTLSASVRVISKGGVVEKLSASRNWAVEQAVGDLGTVDDLYLTMDENGYKIAVKGLAGEAKPGRVVGITLRHMLAVIWSPETTELATDGVGFCHLGQLHGVAAVEAWLDKSNQLRRTWDLAAVTNHHPNDVLAVQGYVGQPLRLGCPLKWVGESHDGQIIGQVALLEVVGRSIPSYSRDYTSQVAVDNGWLELPRLPPGRFELTVPWIDHPVHIEIIKPPPDVVPDEEHAINQVRAAELSLEPLTVSQASGQGQLCIELRGCSTETTRVHVLLSHLLLRGETLCTGLATKTLSAIEPLSVLCTEQTETDYLSGHQLGDEYRYVMERRWAEHLGAKVGNMLPRPRLLLQPWPLRKTRPPTPEQLQDSTSFLSHAQDSVVHRPCPASAFHRYGKKLPELSNQADSMVSRLVTPPPFYPEPLLLSNLRPDSQGRVVIPAHALPSGSSIAQVVAVDVGKKRQQTVSCSFFLSSQPSPGYKDTTLKKGLTPGKHYVEERLSDVLKPGRQIDIADTTSQVQIYDTVAKVHGLFTSLMRGRPGEDKWKDFSFVAEWPKLSLDTKRKLHAQYASHELNFYLFCKDQDFFNAHVKPSLETKMDCDFLDLWLLKCVSQVKAWAADLKGYQNLNAAERCLLAFVLPTEASAFVVKELEDWNADTSNMSPAEGDRRFTVALKGGTLSDLGAAAATGFTEASDGGEDHPSGAGQPQQYVSTRAGGHGAYTAAPQDDEGDWEMVALAGERGRSNVSSGLQTTSAVLPRSRYMMQDMVMRQRELQQLFRPPELTEELCETYYWRTPLSQTGPDLIPISPFWAAFARHAALQDQTQKTASVPWTPFLTSNLTDAVETFTGSMMALAILDLPFGDSATLPAHQVNLTGEGFTFLPSWPVVYYCQQLHEIVAINEQLSGASGVLLSQTLIDPAKPDKLLKWQGPLISGKLYHLRATVNNLMSSSTSIVVLLQIPQGAVPVGGSHTIVERHQLAPLHMVKVEIRFYFPQEGSFTLFPAHVSRGSVRGVPDSGEDGEIVPGEQTGKAWEGELLAFAQGLPTSLQVVAAAMSGRVALRDDEAWTHTSQLGTENEVLDALRTANIRKLDLTSLAWRMKSSAFFKDTISILRQRKMYSHKLWAYGILHKDAEAVREFVAHCPHLVASCRHPVSAGTLLPLHSGSRGRHMQAFYEHLEYSPWVNARAHTVGKGGRASQRLSSSDLRAQYRSFLALLVRLPAGPSGPTGHHALQAAYYLLLQDRVDDAARLFSNVRHGDHIPKLQAGYMAAYLDMSMVDSELGTAGHVAEKHAPNCPVSSWQPYFQELADQVQALRQSELDEGRAKGDIVVSRAAPPAILEVEADREGKLVLRFQGIASIQVNAYIIDEELLFSKDPFRARKAEQPPYVVPNWTHNVSEDKHESSESLKFMKLELPQMLSTVNVLLEARGGGLQRMLSRFRTPRMTSEVTESRGVLTVRKILESGIAGPPLPGAYVKVYARYRQDANGQGAGRVSFYKDGYTDRLGKFDYASVSTDELIKVEKLAILIAQRELGTLEREVAPPAI